jgi:orotate phosphoribosyltransferase
VSYQEKFLDLLLTNEVLQFGDFQTKSGRRSPYFFNTGKFDSGRALNEVAKCYADLFTRHIDLKEKTPHLYGPAYKGIPLATSLAQELSTKLQRDVPFTFNRKEVKDHGEGGRFVGRSLNSGSSVIIVEDVMTGGTSVRESLDFLRPLGVKVEAVLLGIDREEKGTADLLATQEITSKYNIPVYSILTLTWIVEALLEKPRLGRVWIDSSMHEKVLNYRR